MANPFVHLELATRRRQGQRLLRPALQLDVRRHQMPGMVYSTFKPDSGPGGGIFTMPGAPTMWLPYVGVEDINAATDKAKSLGATIHKGPMEIPNVGWMTILADPTGATIALFQPKM